VNKEAGTAVKSPELTGTEESVIAEAELLPSPWRNRFKAVAWTMFTLGVTFAIWEYVSQQEIVNPIVLPPATEVVSAFVELLGERLFWDAVWVTVQETLIGFLIGCAAAWILGTLIGLSDTFRFATYPSIVAFQNTPRVAFAPLFLTWFGFGLFSKIMMAAAICFFPLLIAVVVGLQTVDGNARALMQSFGASKWQMYWKVGLPSSLPFFFAGLKTAMTLALIGAIVAEFVGANEGIGVLIKTFNFQLNVAESFAAIIALMIIGLVLYGLMELADRKIVFWRAQ
jgi:NitT/TauT family transport system permease protein